MKVWFATYLYYAEPWDEFLVQAVKPFTDEVIKSGDAEKYFFIRYWEKGPHIRLRFFIEEDKMASLIKKIDAHFTAYFKETPSISETPKWVESLPKRQQWHPNNSIQYYPYEPETERYGGAKGLEIGEDHFYYCSQAVLSIIEEHEDWSYERALGAAIQLHLSFVHSMKMGLPEAADFFENIYYSWFNRAYEILPGESPEETKDKQDEALKAFEANFASQKETLIPFCNQIWEAFDEKMDFDIPWMTQWQAHLKEFQGKIFEAQSSNKLTYNDNYVQVMGEKIGSKKAQRWFLHGSYIHMINNRIGIFNRDEGYLGFLLMNSLKAISEKQ
ncbi:MAG: thiopeptide-type bacteriocin biosynthesis protein [Sphingobacteriales bacterium]|jgi:thiopeptide-type bacteriocin biosynthesis protein